MKQKHISQNRPNYVSLTADKSLLLIASYNLCDKSLILVLSSLFGFINEDERATVRRPACADEEKGKKKIIITNPSKISDNKHHHQQQTFSVPANHDLMNIHNASLVEHKHLFFQNIFQKKVLQTYKHNNTHFTVLRRS